MTRILIASLILVATMVVSAQTHVTKMAKHVSVQSGKVQAAIVPSTCDGARLFVWSDKKYYLPGESLRIRAMSLCDDATDLHASVTQSYSNGEYSSTESYVCDCGDSNAGSIPSLAGFNFITLVSTTIRNSGKYEFTVTFWKRSGNALPPTLYQTTTVAVYGVHGLESGTWPLRIDSVETSTLQGQPVLVVRGAFPVGQALNVFVGSAPYNGAWGRFVPDNESVLVFYAPVGDYKYEGRIILMTDDGQYSTTSAHTFVPKAMTPGIAAN